MHPPICQPPICQRNPICQRFFWKWKIDKSGKRGISENKFGWNFRKIIFWFKKRYFKLIFCWKLKIIRKNYGLGIHPMPKRCRHRLCPDWLKRENVTKSCILAQFLQKINVFFSRNPPFPKIVTFPLEQKGCHYYELAQYKIVTTAPYVNFCSLKDFFVSSSGFFVIKAKISALLTAWNYFTEKPWASYGWEFFSCSLFFSYNPELLLQWKINSFSADLIHFTRCFSIFISFLLVLKINCNIFKHLNLY